jgi:hypothetical protein
MEELRKTMKNLRMTGLWAENFSLINWKNMNFCWQSSKFWNVVSHWSKTVDLRVYVNNVIFVFHRIWLAGI